MAEIVRVGDKCSGHDGYPSRASTTGSPNVFVNGIPVVRVGDNWEEHCNVSCHEGVSLTGSSTVFANGISICRKGDSVDCGSTMSEGSGNVFAS